MLVKKNRSVEKLSDGRKSILKKGKKTDKVQSSDSFRAIAKTITWPSFPSALLTAVKCLLASAVAGTVFYLYNFGINQIIALIK